MGVVSYRGVDYSNKGPRIQNISEADYAALEQAGTIDPNTVYFRYELEDFGFNVQDDGTATTLLGGKVPTGRTIESYISNKIQDNASATDLTNDKLPTGQTIESYVTARHTPINIGNTGNFTNLANGSYVNTAVADEIPETGYYNVSFYVDHCGANSITSANAYWGVQLFAQGGSTALTPFNAGRNSLVIKTSAWDSATVINAVYYLTKGYYYAKFSNNTGIATNATYGSICSCTAFRL